MPQVCVSQLAAALSQRLLRVEEWAEALEHPVGVGLDRVIDPLDLATLEIAVAEQCAHVVLRAPQQRRARAGRRRVELGRGAEHAPDRSLRRPAADADRAVSARHALQLGRGALVVGGEHVAEGGEHAVEAIVLEGQLLRVALDPLDLHAGRARLLTGEGQQVGLEVESRNARTRPDGGVGGVPGAAGHVEHIHARLHAGTLHADLAHPEDAAGHRVPIARAPHRLRIHGIAAWRLPVPRSSPGRATLPRMDSIVTASEVTRRYGEGAAAVDALAGVSVEFERGRYSAIMGPVGVREVDADAHPRRARPPHLGLGADRRRGDHRARRRRPDQAAPRQARLHLPVLQPDSGAHRARRTSCCRCR